MRSWKALNTQRAPIPDRCLPIVFYCFPISLHGYFAIYFSWHDHPLLSHFMYTLLVIVNTETPFSLLFLRFPLQAMLPMISILLGVFFGCFSSLRKLWHLDCVHVIKYLNILEIIFVVYFWLNHTARNYSSSRTIFVLLLC